MNKLCPTCTKYENKNGFIKEQVILELRRTQYVDANNVGMYQINLLENGPTQPF